MHKSKKWARSVSLAFISVFSLTLLFSFIPQIAPSNGVIQSGKVYASSHNPGAAQTAKSCESEGEVLAWFICPFLKIIDGGAGFLSGQIEDLLNVSSDDYNDDSLRASWRVMRNIALLLLVPMMLLMVIGTALEFGPFDAYTVKKALPRMFIAVMFIVLSLPITQFFVTVSNTVGTGLEGIILSATNEPDSLAAQYSKGGGFLFTPLVGAGALAGIATGAITLSIVGSLALVTFIALLVGYVVLVVRQLLILVLMMMAPLAILVWIFPGNDKIWKVWKATFIALLMMFPLIILLITSGKVFAGVIGDSQNEFTGFFLKTIAFIAPFFFIPATFKYGLGVFGNVAGMINDRSRGIFDRQRKFREGSRANARQAAMDSRRFAGGNETNWRGKMNKGISGTMNSPSAIMSSGNVMSPGNWRSSVNTARNTRAAMEIEQNLDKNADLQPIKGDDDIMRAASESWNERSLRDSLQRADARTVAAGGTARFADPTVMNDTVARVERVRRQMSPEAFKQMSTLQAIAGGTAYDTAGEAWEAVARAGGNDDAATASLVARGRDAAMKAGRVDIGGAGFGATLGQVSLMQDELRRTNTISAPTIAGVNDTIHKGVYESQGGLSMVHSSLKPSSVEQMAPEMVRTVEASIQGGDTRDLSQRFASVAAVYDGMSSSSPQKARIMADSVMSQTINVASLSQQQRDILDRAITVRDPKTGNATSTNRTITYQQAIEGLRGNQEFQEMRREYQSQVAAVQQQGMMGQQPGTPPGGQPPSPFAGP